MPLAACRSAPVATLRVANLNLNEPGRALGGFSRLWVDRDSCAISVARLSGNLGKCWFAAPKARAQMLCTDSSSGLGSFLGRRLGHGACAGHRFPLNPGYFAKGSLLPFKFAARSRATYARFAI